ncbi:TolC family protein [Piscinibacter koreensis]|uniref:TolC family protein n=1 Tax=Piscinibacter koreensis TaxID=2742824 RepID=A0A7Y6NSE0_9BURK|nr:TolC family protein [Schlegelella koreensis]NUZ08460.1 TolC family protein [Schlegelella koreensis]
MFVRSLRRLRPALLLLIAWALHSHAASPLTLDQALRLAQERSRLVTAQEASASASRHMAVAAGQRPDPTLKAGINNLPINGPDRFSLTNDFMTMRSVGVMQEFTRDGKLKARASRFEREAEVAEANRALAVTNLRRDTAIAWLDRYYQERMRDVLIAQRDEARLPIEAAESAYRGGKGSQADVFAARAAVELIEDRLARNGRQIATAMTQLGRWIGTSGADELASSPPSVQTVSLRPEDLESQLTHHPEIVVLFRREALAQADAEVARANKTTDVSVELMYSQRGPAYSNMVSVNVAIPLQWDQANRQDRELAAKLAMVEQMRAEREETTRMHVADALAMLQEWRSDLERLERYDRSLIPLATERTRASIAAYRGGAGALAAVLEARRGEIDTRLERLGLAMETARVWAQLNYLVPQDHTAARNTMTNEGQSK